ncbi:MAG: hypothetical protein ACOCT0_05255, partial [Halobacteriota archaeon]
WIYGRPGAEWEYVLLFGLVVLPLAGYVDARGVRAADVDWNPRAWLWGLGFLVPILNVSVAVPYVLRRHERFERRETWSEWWRLAALGAFSLFAVLLASVGVADYVYPDSAAVDDFFTEFVGLALVFSTALTPAAVRYDVEFVRERFDWEPDVWLWTLGSAVWFVNAFVVGAYAAKRDPEGEFSVVDSEREAARTTVEKTPRETSDVDIRDGDVDSLWWVWPAFTLGLTALALAVGGYVFHGSLEGDDAVLGLATPLIQLVLLLAFVGLFSLYAIYRDCREVSEADVGWRPFWPAYLIAGAFVSPVVACAAYLVQRHRYVGVP